MLRILAIMLWLVFVRTAAAEEEINLGDYYVSANELSVRLAPSSKAKSIDILNRKQRVEVLEVKDGWVRIANYDNGSKGQIGQWVSFDFLTTTEPVGALAENTNMGKYIKHSDDYSKYKEIFIKVSKELVEQGRCNLSDFRNIGGWVRSIAHKSKPIYFTYCGGFSAASKIYINTDTGEILD
jgi:hypothetical protein